MNNVKEEPARVRLGDMAKDWISGFEGLVTADIRYLHGCNQLGLEPRKLKEDGLPHKIQWFDVHRLRKLKVTEVRVSEEKPPGEGVG